MKKAIWLTIISCSLLYKSFSQTWQWGRQTVSTLTNSLCSDVDNKGNIWVSGNYGNGIINFSGNILPAPPPNFSANIFLANYDINGNVLLTKHFSGSLGDVNVYGLKVDNINNIYVSGNFVGTLNLDSDSIMTGGIPSSFVFKTDSLGNVLWAKKLSYQYSSTPCFIDLDSANNIIVVGSYQYTGGGGLTNVFIEKLDSAGNNLFQTIITGQNNNLNFNPLYVAPNGNFYLTGLFEGTATLSTTTISPVGAADIFVTKFFANNNLAWFKNYGTPNIDGAQSVICDENEDVYFTCQIGQKAMLNKLNSSGDSLWNHIVGNPTNDNLTATDLIYRNHKLILSGTYFNHSLTIGSTNFPFAVHSNLYLAQVDTNGNYDWGIIGVNSGGIGAFSLRHLTNDIYVNGNFGGAFGTDTLIIANDTLFSNNPSHAEGYLAKLEMPPTGIININNPSSKIIVAPNPNDGNFAIMFSYLISRGKIEIYNLFGEKVFEENISASITKAINLKNISVGIYLVKVFDGDRSYCKKLIIERN